MAELICNVCSRSNPGDAFICQYCGTPLVRPTPPQIPSPTPEPDFPTTPPAPEQNVETPDWLANLRNLKAEDEKTLGEDFFNRFGSTESTEEPLHNIETSPDSGGKTGAELDIWLASLREGNIHDENLVPDLPGRNQPPPSIFVPPENAVPDQEPSVGGEVPSADQPSSFELPAGTELPEPDLSNEMEPQASPGSSDWLMNIRSRIAKENLGNEKPVEPTNESDWLMNLRKDTGELRQVSATEEDPIPGLSQDLTTAGEDITQFSPMTADTSNLPPLDELNGAVETENHDQWNPVPTSEIPAADIAVPTDEPSLEGLSIPEEALPADFPPVPDLSPISLASGAIDPTTLPPISAPGSIPPFAEDTEFDEFGVPLVPEEPDLSGMNLDKKGDWLTDIMISPATENERIQEVLDSGGQEDDGEFLPKGELPDWVQAARPREAGQRNEIPIDPDHPVEASGPLAGLRGVIQGDSPMSGIAQKSEIRSSENTQDRLKRHTALFLGILQNERLNEPALPETRSAAAGISRWVITGVIFLLVGLPLFLGLTPANLPGVYPRETDNLFQAAAQLPEGAPVLIAVDYDSAFAGEMQSAAAPVINLLKTRKSRFSLLSTSVSGNALAMQLMGYESSDQIIYLGYLPGGQMAIPTLFDDMLKLLPVTSDARFTAVHPAMAGVRNLADYKTIILMTDNPETARAWIEQLTIMENSPPIWLVTSAQAAPMMRPYIRSGQVNAGITGSLGGAQFEVRLNSAGTNIERWNSYYWSLFGGLMVMLLGGIINLLFHSVLTPQKG